MSSSAPFTCSLLAAITADGYIGRSSDHLSTRWTSKEDAAFYRQKSTDAGVIVMGRKTYDTIGKPLPNRVNIVYTRNIPSGEASLESATTLEVGKAYYTNLAPRELVNQLQALGQTSLVVSGGASVYRQFMASGVVDELWLTVEPVMFGEGIRLLDQAVEISLKLEEVIPLSSQTVVLHYQVLAEQE